MSANYRFLWNTLSRMSRSIKTNPSMYAAICTPLRKIPRQNYSTPYLLGFSFFTWLGIEQQEKPTAEDELISTIKHCVLFIQREEYQKAEQLLHVALRQAQQIDHQLGITYIYDVMANLALQREQLDKAKQLFISVTQRVMANGAVEDDPQVIHLSTKLARVSHLKKEYTTAQLGYDWCLEKLNISMQKDPNDETKKLLAMAEDWYGRLFLDCDQFEHGLKLMIQALNRMREVPDVEQEHIVTQLNDIGTVCDRLGRTDESISYFTEAIEMGKHIQMNDLGTMYVNLGRAYLKKKLVDAARKSCGYAWKMSVVTKNEDVKKEAEQCIKQINSI